MKSEMSIANAKINHNFILAKIYVIVMPIVFLISRVSLINNLLPFGLPLYISLYGLNISKLAVSISIILGMFTAGGDSGTLITAISMLLFSIFTSRIDKKNNSNNASKYNRTVPNYRDDLGAGRTNNKPKSDSISGTYETSKMKNYTLSGSKGKNVTDGATIQGKNISDLKLALIGVLSSLIPNIIHVYIKGMLLYDLIIALFHAFVAFVLVFIMRKASSLLEEGKMSKILTNEEIISTAIIGALIISGIGDVKLLGFSIKNVISVLIILVFSFRSGAAAGATVGVIAGLILSISSSIAPLLIGCYALCGLLSGVFKTLGRIGTSLGFLLGNIVLTLYLSGSIEALILIKELVLAIVIFMLIPRKMIIKIPELTGIGSTSNNNTEISLNLRTKEVIVDKLNKFSKTFMEVARTFNELSPAKVIINNQDVSSMLDRVADRVCKDCSLCLHCWDKNFYSTYQVMFKIVEKLDNKGFIDRGDIPQSFINRCERINDFISTVNNMYEIFKVDMMWKNKLGENRSLVSRQLEELSKAITGLADEIQYEIDFKSGIENAISSMLKKEGIRNAKVFAFENKYGKYEVSISSQGCDGAKICSNVIEKIVSHVVGRKMVKENVGCNKIVSDYDESKCTIRFIEEETYDITTGVAFMSKYDERYGNVVNGDSYAFMNTSDGKFVAALSDGMGSGEKAAFQSRATINLIEQFMETGFDKDITIKLINSILALNSSDDYYSTIDLSVIDLDNGKTEFVKIGASPTYIKKNEKIEVVKTVSLPAGILESMEVELVSKQLSDGDMLIMVSDGVLEAYANIDENESRQKSNRENGNRGKSKNGESNRASSNRVNSNRESSNQEIDKEKIFINFVEGIKSINPQTVADIILDEAYKRYDNRPLDDMTVVVTKFWRKIPI